MGILTTGFLAIDLGEQFIKALLCTNENNEIKPLYGTIIENKFVSNGVISNLEGFLEAITEILSEVELNTGFNVTQFVLAISFGKFEILDYIDRIAVDGLITEENVEKLHKNLEDNLSGVSLNDFYSYYVVDKLFPITNPRGMYGKYLGIEGKFLSAHQGLISQILVGARKLNLHCIDICFGPIIITKLLKQTIMLDIGYSYSRLLIKNNIDFIKIGCAAATVPITTISYEMADPHIVDSTNNFFINLFKEVLKLIPDTLIGSTIYISGGASLVPFLDLFLEQRFDRSFQIVKNLIPDFSTKYNPDMFITSFALAKYVNGATSSSFLLQSYLKNTK